MDVAVRALNRPDARWLRRCAHCVRARDHVGQRFLRVADILEINARQGQVATVLSAPAKITNHLVAMIEKTISGQDALPNISDAERIFAEL